MHKHTLKNYKQLRNIETLLNIGITQMQINPRNSINKNPHRLYNQILRGVRRKRSCHHLIYHLKFLTLCNYRGKISTGDIEKLKESKAKQTHLSFQACKLHMQCINQWNKTKVSNAWIYIIKRVARDDWGMQELDVFNEEN